MRNLFRKSKPASSGYKSVDIIRQRLEALDYTPDPNPARSKYNLQSAIRSNEIEDFEYTSAQKAYYKMMLEMRVPSGALWRQCDDWFLSFELEGAI